MPIRTIRKGASKKAKQKHVGKVMHELKHSATKRPRTQMVAIALKSARLSRRKKK